MAAEAPPAPAAALHRGVAAADRKKLQAALDELIVCRRIIETALENN
jgi:hypothetical protein